jgi:hypothetical protein
MLAEKLGALHGTFCYPEAKSRFTDSLISYNGFSLFTSFSCGTVNLRFNKMSNLLYITPVAEQSSLAKTYKGSSDALLFNRHNFMIIPWVCRGLFLGLDGEVTVDGAVVTIDSSASRVTFGVVDGAMVVMDDAVTVDGAVGSRDASALRRAKLGMIQDQFNDN